MKFNVPVFLGLFASTSTIIASPIPANIERRLCLRSVDVVPVSPSSDSNKEPSSRLMRESDVASIDLSTDSNKEPSSRRIGDFTSISPSPDSNKEPSSRMVRANDIFSTSPSPDSNKEPSSRIKARHADRIENSIARRISITSSPEPDRCSTPWDIDAGVA